MSRPPGKWSLEELAIGLVIIHVGILPIYLAKMDTFNLHQTYYQNFEV